MSIGYQSLTYSLGETGLYQVCVSGLCVSGPLHATDSDHGWYAEFWRHVHANLAVVGRASGVYARDGGFFTSRTRCSRARRRINSSSARERFFAPRPRSSRFCICWVAMRAPRSAPAENARRRRAAPTASAEDRHRHGRGRRHHGGPTRQRVNHDHRGVSWRERHISSQRGAAVAQEKRSVDMWYRGSATAASGQFSSATDKGNT